MFRASNMSFFLLTVDGLFVSITAGVAAFYGWRGLAPKAVLNPIGHWRVLLACGISVTASVTLHVLAFKRISVVSYVIACKRVGAILAAVVTGLVLGLVVKHKDFAHEHHNLKARLTGTLFVVVGTALIILFGKA